MSDLLESQESYEIIKQQDPEIIIRLLEASNKEQKERAEQAEAKIKQLEAQIEGERQAFKAQIDQLNIQINTLKSGNECSGWEVIDDNSLTIFQQEKQINQLQESLREKTGELDTLKSVLGLEEGKVGQIFMESATSEVAIENKRLKEQVASLQAELENSRKTIKALQAKVKNLSSQIEKQGKESQLVISKLEEQRAQIETKHNTLKDANEKQRKNHEQMAHDYGARIHQLEEENLALQKDRKQLLNEISRLKQVNSNLNTKLEDGDLKAKLEKALKDNAFLQSENESLGQIVALLKNTEVSEEKRDKLRLVELEREVNILIKQLADGLSENEQLKDQIEKLREENRSLTDFLHQEFRKREKEIKELDLPGSDERDPRQPEDTKTKIVKLFKEFFQ